MFIRTNPLFAIYLGPRAVHSSSAAPAEARCRIEKSHRSEAVGVVRPGLRWGGIQGQSGGVMIRALSAEESIAVRHPVLRPGRPREEAIFACDAEEWTRHFGAFDEAGELVGVVTIHPASIDGVSAWQLRGMATVPAVRGQGHGAALVRQAESVVRDAGGCLLWCNARVVAVTFYERLGWEVVGEEFDIATVGPHFRMIRRL